MIFKCLPENWSVKKIMHEINACYYMVWQANNFLQKKNFRKIRIQNQGKSCQEIVETVCSFYTDRAKPGIKIVLKLSNQVEVNQRFLNTYPM